MIAVCEPGMNFLKSVGYGTAGLKKNEPFAIRCFTGGLTEKRMFLIYFGVAPADNCSAVRIRLRVPVGKHSLLDVIVKCNSTSGPKKRNIVVPYLRRIPHTLVVLVNYNGLYRVHIVWFAQKSRTSRNSDDVKIATEKRKKTSPA